MYSGVAWVDEDLWRVLIVVCVYCVVYFRLYKKCEWEKLFFIVHIPKSVQ